jgi:hypothetical protein
MAVTRKHGARLSHYWSISTLRFEARICKVGGLCLGFAHFQFSFLEANVSKVFRAAGWGVYLEVLLLFLLFLVAGAHLNIMKSLQVLWRDLSLPLWEPRRSLDRGSKCEFWRRVAAEFNVPVCLSAGTPPCQTRRWVLLDPEG